MKKALIIVDSLARNSGVSSVIMNYYRNIDRTKVQYDFLVFNNSTPDYVNEIYSLGGSVYYTPKFHITNGLKIVNFLNHFFKKNSKKYNAIHLHSPNAGFIFFLYGRVFGVNKLIIHCHNSKFSDSRIKAMRNYLLIKPTLLLADHYLSCSIKAGNAMFGKKMMRNGKVTIINNAIDIKKFRHNKEIRANIKSMLNIEDRFVIGHIGRFAAQKNHKFLIDVFKEVAREIPEAYLLLIGDGEKKKEIEQYVKEKNLQESVEFLGVQSNISELLQGIDLFVLPSLFEGLPVVLVEAQATGTKCITSLDLVSPEAKITELISYVPLEKEKWVKEIISSRENYEKKDMSEEIRKAGYDIEHEANRLVEIYLRKA